MSNDRNPVFGNELRQAVDAIDRLNEDELRFLNRLVVDRLKLINQARSTVMLAHFNVGERVSFSTSAGEEKAGVIVQLNKKTASIVTDDGQRWKVHPGYLRMEDAGKHFDRGTGILPASAANSHGHDSRATGWT